MTETKLQPKSRGLDMLHGSIADKLFYFAMPIGLMGLFEQLFNSCGCVPAGPFCREGCHGGGGKQHAGDSGSW